LKIDFRYRAAKICAIILICIFGVVFGGNAWASEDGLPFSPGERLVFELRWGFIPAGEAVLEVMPMKTINGTQAHHFVLTAKTNEFADLIYKVRQRVDAYTDLAVQRSLLYKEAHTHGRKSKTVDVNFDWKKRKAQYANSKKKKRPIDIKPGTFDPLSIFYYARRLDYRENAVFERPVTDGKKCVVGRAEVIQREQIETAIGTFDTYLIEPNLKDVGGVFKKSKNAKIKLWITADHRKIPVRLKSKVIVGSFTGDLVSF
jgi:Protein of unknown function (DUF3108)